MNKPEHSITDPETVRDKFITLAAGVAAREREINSRTQADYFERDARIAEGLGRPERTAHLHAVAERLRGGLPIVQDVVVETSPEQPEEDWAAFEGFFSAD